MKVLITGSDGYIGVVMEQMFLEHGHDVVGLDTDYYYDCILSSSGERYTGGEKIKKDVRQLSAKDFEGIDVICHLAALSNDPVGELNPSLTGDINTKATFQMAEAAKRAGVSRFIFSSSCSLYGASDKEQLDETAEMNPLTAYAQSKVDVETQLREIAEEEFSPVYMRNSTAYGFSPKLRADIVLNNMVGYAVTTGKIVIKSDGTPWRPLVHIRDICKAFILAAEAPKEAVHNEAFNVGANEENYQIKDIASAVKEVIPHCEIVYTHEHSSDQRTYIVNFDKISRHIPEFKTEWNIYRGIEELYENYNKMGLTYDAFNGRKFTRLKQLKHLVQTQQVNDKLYWKGKSDD